MYLETAKRAIEDAGLTQNDIGVMLGGDLLNQIITASYSARDLNIPFLGLYGACSSMTESLAVGSMFISGGFFKNVLCATSSHFATAERQYRFPLEQGAPKPPTGQDTVTAAGATVITDEKTNIKIEYLTVGRVVDFGITDNNNMGAAMAPAAVESLLTHLENRNAQPSDYDAIVTGDLGVFGSEMLCDLAYRLGTDLSPVHKDCGAMIYQGLKGHRSGASGCGCSAVMLNAYFLRKMRRGNVKGFSLPPRGRSCRPPASCRGKASAAWRTWWRSKRKEEQNEFLAGVFSGRAHLRGGSAPHLLNPHDPARILVTFVTAGVFLTALGLYEPLVKFGGAGATVPLTGFGYSLCNGVVEAVKEKGVLGAFTGGVIATAGGITAAIVFGYLASLIFKPGIKK